MFAPLPVGLALLLLCLAVLPFPRRPPARRRRGKIGGHAGAHRRATSPTATASTATCTNSPSAPRARWSACRWAKPKAMHDAPLRCWRCAPATRSRLAPPADAHLGRQRARRDGPEAGRRGFRPEQLPAHERAAAPSSATCSTPAAPAFPKWWCRRPRSYIGKTAGELQLAAPAPASACSRSTATRR